MLALVVIVLGGGALAGWAIGGLLRGVLVTSSGTLQGGRAGASRDARAQTGPVRPGIGVLGKELRLLLRDRSILVGTLIFPAVIISLQVFANPGLVEEGFQDPRHAATIAFCVGAYVLMFTAIRVMSSEGQSLWLLYCVPTRLELLFQRKSLLWGAIASIYTLGVLVYAFSVLPISVELLELGFFAVAGLFVVALLASAIGIFGYDPLSPNPQQQVRFGHVYLCMLLVSLYNYGFYAPDPWTRLGLFLALGLLALSLWQRLRVQLAYVLDPVARPAPRVGLSDGLGTVFVYLVLSGVFGAAMGAAGVDPLSRHVLASATGGAGAIVLLVLLRRLMKTPAIGRQLGLSRAPGSVGQETSWGPTTTGSGTQRSRMVEVSLANGPLSGSSPLRFASFVALAAAAATLAITFDRLGGGGVTGELRTLLGSGPVTSYALVSVLAVIAVPLVHELMFRGVVYLQLRRERGRTFSVVVTTLLYTVVHPAEQAPEHLTLGVLTALAVEGSRSIYPAILVHMVFRAAPLLGGAS